MKFSLEEVNGLQKAESKIKKPSKIEKLLRDYVVNLLRGMGIEVSTDAKEGQEVLDRANEQVSMSKRKKQALETASLTDFGGSTADISSADDAKVSKNLEKLAKDFEKLSNNPVKTFIGSLAMELDDMGNVVELNNISSVHAREAQEELERLSELKEGYLENHLRWVDKEKVSDWLLRLPYEDERTKTNPKHISIAKVIQEFENPKLSGEIILEEPKFSLADEDKNVANNILNTIGYDKTKERQTRISNKEGVGLGETAQKDGSLLRPSYE